MQGGTRTEARRSDGRGGVVSLAPAQQNSSQLFVYRGLGSRCDRGGGVTLLLDLYTDERVCELSCRHKGSGCGRVYVYGRRDGCRKVKAREYWPVRQDGGEELTSY